MIDALVKAAEKIVELLQYKEQREKSQYESVVVPLFEAARLVHSDHLKMLEGCLTRMQQGQDLWSVASELANERLVNEAVRREIVQNIAALRAKLDDKRLGPFLQAAAGYFSADTAGLSLDSRKAALEIGLQVSTVRSIVVRIRQKAWSGLTGTEKSFAHQMIESYLERFRSRWDALAKAHAELRVKTYG